MFQKVFVLGGLNLISFSNGVIFGQIACLVESLKKKNEGIDLSDAQISLIASALITVCIFGYALVAIIANNFGRRWAFIIFSILNIINWIIMFYATEMYQFILSRIVGGVAVGALWKLTIFASAEYTAPNSRAFYLNMINTVAPALGSCLVHSIGIVLHWRIVILISIIPAAGGVIFPYFWVESPHYLASKGKFKECETAFRQLYGRSLDSERELQLLIKMESAKLNTVNRTNTGPFKRFLLASKKRYFWELLLMSFFIHCYTVAGGKLVFTSLATVMLEEITGTSDVLLYTLLVDGFIIIGSCMSCFLIRTTSMRTLLFSTGFAANIMLVVFSGCYYFKNGQSISNWVNVSLLALYFILVHSGPYPLTEAIYSEMFPLELKLYMFSISAVVLILYSGLSMFLLPYIVNAIGYHGLFLLNAAITSVSLGYLWLKWPETKGRTLQEIETYFKANNFDVEEVLNKEQTNNLI